MLTFENKVILVTGGTGSFGSAFIKRVLKESVPRYIIVYSRDEAKQHKLNLELNSPRVKFVVGDIRDKERLRQVMGGVDYVFHAAAMKQVPACEFNPMEAVMTNVIGTNNVIDVSIEAGVKKVIGLSTDKAVDPFSVLGMSKGIMERMISSRAREQEKTVFCMTRFGNLICSNGSAIPMFINQAKTTGVITVTCKSMLRFLMRIDDAIDLVLYAFEHGKNGELFVKKAPIGWLGDIVNAVIDITEKPCMIRTIGIRHGEKLEETLISKEEMIRTEDCGDYFKVLPDTRGINYNSYSKEVLETKGVKYCSSSEKPLSYDEVKTLLLRTKEVRELL